MSNEHNPPAFPLPEYREYTRSEAAEGMSLRDYFAGKALAGITMYERRNGYPEPGNPEIKYAAEAAYAYADAMLEARQIKNRPDLHPDDFGDPVNINTEQLR